MLVLDRSVNEQIVIDTSDGPVTVTVLERRRGVIRIGVQAPAKCIITRPECHTRPAKKETK